MARLHDAKQVIHALGFKELGRRIWQQTGEDDLFTWAASLAYSWMFAVFPFLIFLLSIVPLLPKVARDQAMGEIDGALRNLPNNAADPIRQQAQVLLNQPHGGLLSIGLLITIWAASSGMSMTMEALDRCYDIKNGRSYLMQRAVAALLTIVAAIQIILVMVLMPVASIALAWLREHGQILGPVLILLNLVRFAIAIALLLCLLAMVYRWGVSLKTKFQMVTPGAMFCVAVWIILAFSFRLYINKFGASSYDKTYGAVAGVAILLLFFYVDAVVLLIGCEINSEIDFAMLGMPSSPEVTVQQFDRHHTQEHRALMQELKAKRQPINPPPTPAPLVRVADGDTRASWTPIGLLAASAAAWTLFKALHEARAASFEKERLKHLYPETWDALTERDGR